MLYQDIVGQSEAKARLQKMVNEARVPHALLFSGAEGTGGLPMALAFSQHLLCKSPNANGVCGQCASCQKVSKLVHPDLHLVFPIARSASVKTSEVLIKEFREAVINKPYLSLNEWFSEVNAENKQPIIPADEASDILRKLSYTSFEGSYKIMIIWHADKMNTEAANKLLKILEEPPDQTVFILVCSYIDQLLATIISRVQQIPLYQCSDEDIATTLQEKYEIHPDVARQAAMLSGGSFGEALQLVSEDEQSLTLHASFQNFMRLCYTFNGTTAVECVDELAAMGREKQKQFLQYGLEVFRDCLMYNYGSKDLVRLSGDERKFLEKFAPFINQRNYELITGEFNSNYYYIERNANAKVLFMDLMMKMRRWIKA